MSARSLRAVSNDVPPYPTNPDERPKPKGMTLKAIDWGKRDEALGKLVCRHVREANPPLVIEYNPITFPRLVRYLRACGVPA